MLNIIGALIALGILVIVHETGHLVAARIFGVEVEKFSIGFGPKLFGFRKGKTEYRISLIPLGGYLKMKGENPDEKAEESEDSFKSKKWWQRALIAFAGPFFNLVFAAIVFIASFAVGRSFEDHLPVVGKITSEIVDFVQVNDEILEVNDNTVQGWSQIVQYTKPDEMNYVRVRRNNELVDISSEEIRKETWYTGILPFSPAVVGEVAPGLPAYKSGLMKGDEILSVDGIDVNDWYEMREIITESSIEEVKLKIKRSDNVFEKSLKLEENLLDNNRIIGITQELPVKIEERYNLGESIVYGAFTTVNFVVVNYSMLFKLITNPKAIKANLGGPVMLYTMSQQTAKKGLDTILAFIGMISIILMIMNLLPIPILDGGQIFFCFIEGIKRKPLSFRIQIVMQNIGLFILIFLMVFAFWNDINRIFSRNMAIRQQEVESR
ncbi:MAG: RIP metalloprotease RseP [Candidatus Cloacimonetes bacterium]|nr:RIP metalloprotease RseP [Candidatus Cloacimonadota bacterium]